MFVNQPRTNIAYLMSHSSKVRYTIRAKDQNKVKYFDGNGLHSGRSNKRGYNIFDSKKEAEKFIVDLKKVFNSWIIFEVIEDSEIPFIKRQLSKKPKIFKLK